MAGNKLGEGLGLCSTMEKKYRYRSGEGEVIDVPIPKGYWDTRSSDPAKAEELLVETANKAGYPGKKFGTKKMMTASGAFQLSAKGLKMIASLILTILV